MHCINNSFHLLCWSIIKNLLSYGWDSSVKNVFLLASENVTSAKLTEWRGMPAAGQWNLTMLGWGPTSDGSRSIVLKKAKVMSLPETEDVRNDNFYITHAAGVALCKASMTITMSDDERLWLLKH